MVREGDEASASRKSGFDFTRIPARFKRWIGVAEYVVIGLAAANVMHLTYQLDVHAIVVFAPETIFLLPLWTSLCVVYHLFGVFALHIMREHPGEVRDMGRKDTWFRSWPYDELIPSAFQEPENWLWRTDSTLFHATTWLLSIRTVMQTMFGTLILSSLLFFSVTDSVTVVARYAGSTIACRAVLRFELSGMSWSHAAKHQQESETTLTTTHIKM